jgi:hypothetical protein
MCDHTFYPYTNFYTAGNTQLYTYITQAKKSNWFVLPGLILVTFGMCFAWGFILVTFGMCFAWGCIPDTFGM